MCRLPHQVCTTSSCCRPLTPAAAPGFGKRQASLGFYITPGGSKLVAFLCVYVNHHYCTGMSTGFQRQRSGFHAVWLAFEVLPRCRTLSVNWITGLEDLTDYLPSPFVDCQARILVKAGSGYLSIFDAKLVLFCCTTMLCVVFIEIHQTS